MLVFNHIPKAAGTSLKSILKKEFKDKYYEGTICLPDVDAILAGKYEVVAPTHIEIVLQHWHRENKVPEFVDFWNSLIRSSMAITTVRSPIDRFWSFVRNSNQLLNRGQGVGWYSSYMPLALAIEQTANEGRKSKDSAPPSFLANLPHPAAQLIFEDYLEKIEAVNGVLQTPLYLSNPFRELAGQTSALNLKQMAHPEAFNHATHQFRGLAQSSFAFMLYNTTPNERSKYVSDLFFPGYNLVASQQSFDKLLRKLKIAGILPADTRHKVLNSSNHDHAVQHEIPCSHLVRKLYNLLPADFLLTFAIDFCGGLVENW